MNSVPADLTSRDLWSESLERSQARRRRAGVVPGYSALELLPAQPRDLTDPEVWVRSGWRSRARREAAAHKSEMLAPSPRGLSLAALLAVTGVPAAGVISGALGGSGGTEAQAKTAVASRGSGVSALQRAIGVSADGVFGPQTQKAVKAYQRNHGLTADGIAGPQTRSRLGMGPGPVLKRGGKARASGVRRHPLGGRPRRRRPGAAARHRRVRRRRLRPPDRGRAQALAGLARAGGRRHRRPDDPREGRARPRSRAQAQERPQRAAAAVATRASPA